MSFSACHYDNYSELTHLHGVIAMESSIFSTYFKIIAAKEITSVFERKIALYN